VVFRPRRLRPVLLGAALLIGAGVLVARRQRSAPPAARPVAPPAEPARAEPAAAPAAAPPEARPAAAPRRGTRAAEGSDDQQRRAQAIDALVAKGDMGRARAEAEELLRLYPSGAEAVRIERLTGVHPHPPDPVAAP
jgi:hypothetical protein